MTGTTRLALLALGIGTIAGVAAITTRVTWPPVVALVAGCAFVGFAAPRHAWPLGVLAGLAAAVVHGGAMSSGWQVPSLYGVLGPFGVVLPALVGTHVGQMAAAFAARLRGGARVGVS